MKKCLQIRKVRKIEIYHFCVATSKINCISDGTFKTLIEQVVSNTLYSIRTLLVNKFKRAKLRNL